MSESIDPNEPQAELELGKYLTILIFIWVSSWYPSIILLIFFYKSYLLPDLPIYANISVLINYPSKFLLSLFIPAIILILYIFRQFMVALISKIFLAMFRKISPEKEMIAARGIGKQEAKDVNYYHLRGAIFRLLKWTFSKSPFPWFTTWAFQFVGANKYGKRTVLEDQFYTHEFLTTGEDVYIGQGSIISSHLVEGKYGAITLKRVIMGDHVVLSAFDAISPGVYLEPYTELMPISAVTKFQRVRGYSKYYGLPIARISFRRYFEAIQLPKEYQDEVLKLKAMKKAYRKEKAKLKEKIQKLEVEKESKN